MHHLDTIDYLKNGNYRQQQAYKVLSSGIIATLNPYSTILAGTIPLEIDIENSDLDILCYSQDSKAFKQTLIQHFADEKDFVLREIVLNGEPTILANFELMDFEIEIFGQNIPVKEQNGYKHMIIEHEILERESKDFKSKIVELKKQGYKTEPAFAKLLGLQGDPYIALLQYIP